VPASTYRRAENEGALAVSSAEPALKTSQSLVHVKLRAPLPPPDRTDGGRGPVTSWTTTMRSRVTASHRPSGEKAAGPPYGPSAPGEAASSRVLPPISVTSTRPHESRHH